MSIESLDLGFNHDFSFDRPPLDSLTVPTGYLMDDVRQPSFQDPILPTKVVGIEKPMRLPRTRGRELESQDLLGNQEEAFRHPEGLTTEQEKLIDLLFTVPISAPAPIGRFNEDGTFEQREIRTDRAIAIAPEGWGFIFAHHEEYPNAPLAPIKVNLRQLPPEILDQAGRVYAEMIAKIGEVDMLVSIPDAGRDLGRAASAATGIPHIDLLVKEITPDGKRELKINPAWTVKDITRLGGRRKLIVDDVVAKGANKKKTLAVLGEAGLENMEVAVLINRGEGGMEEMARDGIKAHAAIEFTDLQDYAARKGYISQEKVDESREYSRQTRELPAAA